MTPHHFHPELYREIGQRVRYWRRAFDMTQQELADAVRTSRANISNIEAGRQHVFIHTLYAIAESVGCQITDLLP